MLRGQGVGQRFQRLEARQDLARQDLDRGRGPEDPIAVGGEEQELLTLDFGERGPDGGLCGASRARAGEPPVLPAPMEARAGAVELLATQ